MIALHVCAVLMETMDSLHLSDSPVCLCCVNGDDGLYIRVISLHVSAVLMETMDSLRQSECPVCLCCVNGDDDGLSTSE